MKIFVFGAAAVGKTAIVAALAKELNCKVVAIDEFRNKEERNGHGEAKAKNRFLKEIDREEHQLVEATGFGRLGAEIKPLVIQDRDNLFVLLTTKENIRQKRLTERKRGYFGKYNRAPPPNEAVRNFYSRFNYLELDNSYPQDIPTNTQLILAEYGKIQSSRTN